MIKTLAELLANATRSENGCLLWNGPFNTRGYGIVHSGKRHTTAHRIVLELLIGRTLSRQEYACHHCDNPPCIEPEHLFAGSQSDNMQDCLRKGRFNAEKSPTHRKRLSESVIRARNQGRSLERVLEIAGELKMERDEAKAALPSLLAEVKALRGALEAIRDNADSNPGPNYMTLAWIKKHATAALSKVHSEKVDGS